ADVGWWQLGTSDAFYGVVGFPGGIPYKSYANWDAGLAFTWEAFTLDLRYYQSNLSKGDCNAFTSDHTAAGVALQCRCEVVARLEPGLRRRPMGRLRDAAEIVVRHQSRGYGDIPGRRGRRGRRRLECHIRGHR